MKELKVALVHDWLTGFRGGEKVLEVIAEIFPKAPLYTLVHIRGSTSRPIEDREIHTSFLQNMPLGKTKYRHYLPLFPLAAQTLVPSGYDLIISTSHAVAKSVNTHGAKHWCYIHSPMRYVWDRFDDYFGAELVGTLPSKLFFSPIAQALRSYDRKTARRVDQYVANSEFVKERVKKFYDREADVIHPPVDVERFRNLRRKPEDFYLFFSALVPYKRVDHAILACVKLNRKLVVLGKGPELEKLKAIANSDLVSFVEPSSDAVVDDYYSRARALLFPAVEDFGIVPCEATASGLPVIGLAKGGLLDSQTEETCVFYSEQSVVALSEAILRFEKAEGSFNREEMAKHASQFSRENFRQNVTASIEKFKSKYF